MEFQTGLIGWPLGHTLSPAMHNAAFRALGLEGQYDALATPPDQVAELVRSLANRGYLGVNVTIPHKQAVMPLMDELSDAARLIGAVNTITVKRSARSLSVYGSTNDLADRSTTLRGGNTDWLGFLHPLDARGVDLTGASVLLLGAGGAARAVVYALARRGVTRIAIWNRNSARAAELASHAGSIAPQMAIDHSSFIVHGSSFAVDLVVNTTPLGMWPHVAESPWPAGLPFPPGALVYDLVYRPERTLLLRQAEAAGNPTQGGLEMLAVQAAAAFELWTGQAPPLDVMMAAARDAIAPPR